jgi:hypothetical protein
MLDVPCIFCGTKDFSFDSFSDACVGRRYECAKLGNWYSAFSWNPRHNTNVWANFQRPDRRYFIAEYFVRPYIAWMDIHDPDLPMGCY